MSKPCKGIEDYDIMTTIACVLWNFDKSNKVKDTKNFSGRLFIIIVSSKTTRRTPMPPPLRICHKRDQNQSIKGKKMDTQYFPLYDYIHSPKIKTTLL